MEMDGKMDFFWFSWIFYGKIAVIAYKKLLAFKISSPIN
jgi:hypothetical protein